MLIPHGCEYQQHQPHNGRSQLRHTRKGYLNRTIMPKKGIVTATFPPWATCTTEATLIRALKVDLAVGLKHGVATDTLPVQEADPSILTGRMGAGHVRAVEIREHSVTMAVSCEWVTLPSNGATPAAFFLNPKVVVAIPVEDTFVSEFDGDALAERMEGTCLGRDTGD